MSTVAPPAALQDQIRSLILDELPRLRLDREMLEAALDAGEEARIPSRKALVVIARVCRSLGVDWRLVRPQDLDPDQVADLHTLVRHLAERTAPHLGAS